MSSIKKHRSASVWFIFVTILLDAIGLGLLIPVLPDVLRRFYTDPEMVTQSFGYFVGVYALMQFVASPVLGSLSDRYGRRSILLISLLGAGLDYIFMAFAPSVFLLFIGRMISGLTGASMTVASSYMADVSDDSNRSANFGLIGAAWGVGFIAGPLLGGIFSSLGMQAPFLAAAALNIINFLFGLFVLPESLAPENRRNLNFKKMNPFSSLAKILKPSPILPFVIIYFLITLSGQVHPVNWTLYTETKFGWTPWEVGLSLSFVGLTIALAAAFFSRWIIPKLGEVTSLTLGLIIYIVGYAAFGFASQGWMMYAIMTIFCLSGIAMPALQSIVSKNAPSNQQGELQGSLISIASVSAVLAPLIYSYLFVQFTKPGSSTYFPGAAYIGASLFCIVALGLRSLTLKKN